MTGALLSTAVLHKKTPALDRGVQACLETGEETTKSTIVWLCVRSCGTLPLWVRPLIRAYASFPSSLSQYACAWRECWHTNLLPASPSPSSSFASRSFPTPTAGAERLMARVVWVFGGCLEVMSGSLGFTPSLFSQTSTLAGR